jgi:V8-like Glu-specific endopeptidase
LAVRIITDEKNLAFANQPKPLTTAEAKQRLNAERAKAATTPEAPELSLFVSASGEPRLAHEAVKVEDGYAMQVRLENAKLGQHAFPPPSRLKAVKTLGDAPSRGERKALALDGLRPGHLDFRPTPRSVPKALQTPPFYRAVASADERGNRATTIFPPDNRAVFHDTSFPWSCFGRVDSPGGFGSGVMVGPRHLLTVSHIVQWLPDNQAGWIRFRPSFFDGSAPFGEAWATWTYYKYKVSGPTIDLIEGMYDYVCVVLNQPIGNLTGWIGSRGYTDSWDGGTYWSHIGYPGDLTGGNRPTFQGGIALDGAWWEFDSHEAMAHHADVWPGQSGGPFFGWWGNEPWPRAVAVQSSQNQSENNGSGGQDMVDLIITARNDHP